MTSILNGGPSPNRYRHIGDRVCKGIDNGWLHSAAIIGRLISRMSWCATVVNPRGRDTESFVAEAKEAIKAIDLPSGYFVEWSGTFKNLQTARSRLSVLAPLALLLVLMMIYAAFKNIAQTFLIFLCVPLALVGGVLALIANGLPFSISAGVGFIALSGIAVLNGVVLLNYYNELEKEGLRGISLIKRGSLLRLRPVLMTALVDIFGFLPMMLSSGVGSEVQRPLATVVIGGVISSTALTLLVLPALYHIYQKFSAKDENGLVVENREAEAVGENDDHKVA